MFHMMTASFLAVALTAAVLPLRYNTFLKKSDRCVSFKLPIALAALRKAIFNLLLPLGTLLLMIFPPVFLLSIPSAGVLMLSGLLIYCLQFKIKFFVE